MYTLTKYKIIELTFYSFTVKGKQYNICFSQKLKSLEISQSYLQFEFKLRHDR